MRTVTIFQRQTTLSKNSISKCEIQLFQDISQDVNHNQMNRHTSFAFTVTGSAELSCPAPARGSKGILTCSAFNSLVLVVKKS